MESTRFIQQCPWCGRSLHISVEYLNKKVACRHCRGRFVASDRGSSQVSASDSGLALLRRAEDMLQLVQESGDENSP